MTKDTDLLKRLRMADEYLPLGHDGWEAADRIEALEAELHLMKTSGVAEVAVRNPSVMEYMKHWEGRAETAEAKLAKNEALMQAGFAEYERRLAKAVEAAYREGFLAGTADGWVNNPRIKVEWKRSKALAELKGDKT